MPQNTNKLNGAVGLSISLALPCFLGSELSSVAFLALGLLLYFRCDNFRTRPLRRVMVPLLLLALLGSHGLLYNEPYNVVKDAWYLLKIVLLFCIGYLFFIRCFDRMVAFQAVVLAGALASLWHLIQAGIAYENGMTFAEVRVDAGVNGYLISAISLAVLLGLPNSVSAQIIGPKLRAVSLVVCIVSMGVALSRTYWISIAIILLFLRINTARQFRLIAFFIFAVFSAIALFGARTGDDEVLEGAHATLAEKFLNSVAEVSVREYEDRGDINDRWRGYEAFRALITYLDYPLEFQFIGGGFGSLVELGLPMVLNGVEFEAIPMLHNGYLYVLIKYGAVGMFLYLWFFYMILFGGAEVRKPCDSRIVRQMLLGLVIMLLADTFVVTGVFNKDLFDSVIILMGFLYASRNFPKIYVASDVRTA